MAGIMEKIGDALHMGGNKDEKKPAAHGETHYGDDKKHVKEGEHKEGMMDKLKDKIGGGHGAEHKDGEKIHKVDGEKKKKKEKKKKHGEDGHDHGGSSSSSDSD